MCIYCLHWPRERTIHGETNREETNVNVTIKHLSQECTATKIAFMYSFSGNSVVSAPISTFMCL